MSSRSQNSTLVSDPREASLSHRAPASHPRGAGFRVLSRLARTHAERPEGYTPRHRSGDEQAATA